MLFANQAPTKPNLSNYHSHVGKVCTQKAPQNSACTCKIFRRLCWKVVYHVCASISQQANQQSVTVTLAGVYATMNQHAAILPEYQPVLLDGNSETCPTIPPFLHEHIFLNLGCTLIITLQGI